ncbi:MAG: 50S ribosomal protein L4 [Candidatus Paceibacterota bacterium]|jgi:large subunit ribosomal protein L4
MKKESIKKEKKAQKETVVKEGKVSSLSASIYNQTGKETGKISLPANIFGLKWNADLVHQIVTSILSNKRAGTADTKGRGEVRGGGKKPWKQKGTGRARHGSSRSPIWKGGGVTHGPLAEKNYKKKINKKMMVKALYVVLSEKMKKNEILFIDQISIKEIKTKSAKEIIETLAKVSGFEKLSTKRKNAAIITIFGKDKTIDKSFNNLPSVSLIDFKNINPLDIMNSKYLIVANPEESIAFLKGKL